jgi:hypothetical protein
LRPAVSRVRLDLEAKDIARLRIRDTDSGHLGRVEKHIALAVVSFQEAEAFVPVIGLPQNGNLSSKSSFKPWIFGRSRLCAGAA